MSYQQNVDQAALSSARAEGAAAERARISAIVSCPEAKGKEVAAITLALAGATSTETAKVILSGSDFDRGKALAKAAMRR